MFDAVEIEIFKKYKNALIAIGVDLLDESVIDCIEGCSYDLEARLQAIISYWYWLKTQDREIIDPNQLLINAFFQEWKPIGWQDKFLDNEDFKSPAEKWWNKAQKIDILNSLIIDVQDNFWSGGKVVFKDFNGEPWTMDLDRAMNMTWGEIIEHYQRVTGITIETHSGHFLLHKDRNKVVTTIHQEHQH